MYTKSYNRAIPYVIGIMGAFYTKHLQQTQFQFSSVAVKIFMFSAAVIGTHIMFIVPMLFVSSGHQYNVWEHVLYAPLHRLVWAVAMCNFIVVHNAGGYGVISSFLGCRLFAPLSRLCYGVYLTHVAIMLIELGSSHSSEYVTMIGLTQDIFGDLSMSLLVSFVLNLLLESPLDTFHKKLKRSILNHMEASKRTQVYPISAQVGIDSRRTYLKPTGILPRYKIDPEENQP
ncbi:O-acyltransferase like protein-like isoform X2 [Diaphorina citri]|uniref:O-acyltransferase like protein-like isoform X2 n=1 Tax=Diaphorina citri TaxID=121845 RepID=A0A1S3D6D2_DIACI|nr:O-acyltransferase like protein-like isoform X2 [Diaphorina citri]